MNFVVDKTMHFSDVSGVAFNAIDSHLPVLSFVAARIVFRLEDVRVLAKQVAPFPKTDPNIQNRLRLELPNEVDHGRDGVRRPSPR